MCLGQAYSSALQSSTIELQLRDHLVVFLFVSCFHPRFSNFTLDYYYDRLLASLLG
jgi:hypothetical protein